MAAPDLGPIPRVLDPLLQPGGVVPEAVLLVPPAEDDPPDAAVGDDEGEDGECEEEHDEEEEREEVEPKEAGCAAERPGEAREGEREEEHAQRDDGPLEEQLAVGGDAVAEPRAAAQPDDGEDQHARVEETQEAVGAPHHGRIRRRRSSGLGWDGVELRRGGACASACCRNGWAGWLLWWFSNFELGKEAPFWLSSLSRAQLFFLGRFRRWTGKACGLHVWFGGLLKSERKVSIQNLQKFNSKTSISIEFGGRTFETMGQGMKPSVYVTTSNHGPSCTLRCKFGK
jgi:hypothetical protein